MKDKCVDLLIKAHKKLNRSSKCPSWLKETKK